MNQNYNPFKMWGSYVVFAVIISISLLNLINMKTLPECAAGGGFTDMLYNHFDFNNGNSSCDGFIYRSLDILILPTLPILFLVYPNIYFAFIIYAIFGFLIGWGIHSLVRKVKSR